MLGVRKTEGGIRGLTLILGAKGFPLLDQVFFVQVQGRQYRQVVGEIGYKKGILLELGHAPQPTCEQT